ncbi:MAG: HupE/UreJ family protein [Leptospirales bacterium]|nr:HupE/UreJ family protein [Leptospirales bacterium]
MRISSKNFFRFVAIAMLLSPAMLFAHHAEFMKDRPFLQGVSMPVHGLDHMLLTFAVGLIAGMNWGKRGLIVSGLFLAAILIGGVVNIGGAPVQLVEPIILASVILVGTYLGLNPKLPLALGIGALVVFAVAHGHAILGDNFQALTGAHVAWFLAGCSLSAIALLAIGALVGRTLKESAAVRYIGYAMIAIAPIVTAFPAINSIVITIIE